MMGKLAVEWLHRIKRGERPPSRILDTGVEVVTKENAKQAASLL
jgi:ABC-type sugar transport system substrate-binding protein